MPGSGALKRPAFSEFPGLASKPKSENCRLLPREQAKEGQLNMPLSPAPQPQSNPVEGVPEHSPARILVADDSVISQRAAFACWTASAFGRTRRQTAVKPWKC